MKKLGMFFLIVPIFTVAACNGKSGTKMCKSLDDINDFYSKHSAEYVSIESLGNSLLPIGDDSYVRWVSESEGYKGGLKFSICVMKAVSNPDQSGGAETIAVALEYPLCTEDAIEQSLKDNTAKVTLDEKTFYNYPVYDSTESNAAYGNVYAYQYNAQTHKYKDSSMLHNESSFNVKDNKFDTSLSGSASELEKQAIKQSASALFDKFVKFLKDNSFANLFGTYYSFE